MKNPSLSIGSRFNSFIYAWKGLQVLLLEPNFKIHVFAMLCSITLGLYLQISKPDWILIILAIFFVIVTETLNTSIEYLADSVSLDYDKNIEIAKNLGATSVLFSSIFAVLIGFFVFLPRVISP